MKIKDRSGFITTSGFFLVIALSFVFFNRTPGKESAAENRRLAEFPKIRTEEGGMSPSLRGDLEDWFEDNLGLRDQYLTLSGIIEYNLFNRARTPKVELGDNGFLYLADEGNLQLEASKYSDFISRLPEYASDQQRIAGSLKDRGIDYVFYIAPGKPVIYPEYILSSHHVTEDTIGDAMYDYLLENTDVHVSYPKDALLEAKADPSNGYLYLQTDTHWNSRGRYIALGRFINELGDWGIIDTRPCEVEFFESDEHFVGDLSNMMGVVTIDGRRLEEESYTDWRVMDPKAYEVTSGEKYERFRALLDTKNVYNAELAVMYRNDDAPDKKVLIFGDSMFRNCLMPELAESFSEVTFVWSYRVDNDFIDAIGPDLVISEFGERELPLRLDGLYSNGEW